MILVNSEYVKQSFLDNGFDSNKIKVVVLGINKAFLGLKKKWDIKNKTKLVFTGGFGARKGGKLIIEMCEYFEKNGFNYSLDIYGQVLNDLVIPESFKQSKNITIHGFIEQKIMLSKIIDSDIYVFPSYVEGAAQSLKEAMAIGLPVITTFQSGVNINNNYDGILVKDDSSKELINAVIELSNNYEKRKKIAQNAINTIKNNHTWEKYALEVNHIYEEL